MPTVLASDGLTLNWTFDDGPGKTVRNSERWSLDNAGQSLTITSGGKRTRYRISELTSVGDGKGVTLILDGEATENGNTVTARLILTKSGPKLRLTKMTRQVGELFLMRNSYELTQ